MEPLARVLAVIAAAATTVALAAVPAAARPHHHRDRSDPDGRTHRTAPLFKVGAAVESLDPSVPVYSGGFGASPPIQKVYGHLEVRALYISNGRRAVAFAIVDSQAYFAAYQEGPNYGITSVRQLAAGQMSRYGPRMSQADIIVQGTHSHSASTLEGIWGPVPLPYLKLVHDQTVAALTAAARNAQPANLQYASVDAPELDNSSTEQYDSFPGWIQDGQLSVLRATAPGTGQTIATMVNVPAHPDIVCGACLKTLTADYFGAVRQALDEHLGGITLATPATLGREESPVQATGIGEMQWFARVVAALAGQALAHAHPITNPTLSSAESMVQIPGSNAALLALVEANHLPDSAKQQMFSASGEYPIDRQDTPPYLAGGVIGTYLTAVRIGPLAYVSMPGEPFPEVRLTIAKSVHDAVMVIALSKGQDDLGYYYPSWVYPFTEVYPTDQGTFSVAPQAGDQIIEGQLANVHALGFQTDPVAVPAPLPTDYAAALQPGLQALASPPVGDAGPDGTLQVTLQAIYAPAEQNGAPLQGALHWSFGDGTSATSSALSFGGPCGSPTIADTGATNCPQTGPAYLQHDFRPGSYRVSISGQDADGHPVSYALTVTVYPRLRVGWRILDREGRVVTMRAVPHGGTGRLLVAHWHFPGGAQATGFVVKHRFARGQRIRAQVSGVDAASVSG